MGRSGMVNTTPFQQAIKEAERLQQRAERRSGLEALPAYEKAVAAFKVALEQSTLHDPQASKSTDEDALEAWLCLAECYQNWGDCIQSTVSSLPDSELTQQVEAQAHAKACALYGKAVEAYQMASLDPQSSSNGTFRADAAVNCANTLSSWAELMADKNQRVGLLERAVALYRAALSSEPDALTWGNLADAEVAAAVALATADAEQSTASRVSWQELGSSARESYLKACELSSSEQGDDLPGLLSNWGTGLTALADLVPETQGRRALLEAATQRLREAASFDRGDPAPLCTLGDALASAAELANTPAEAVSLLGAAIRDGYASALALDSKSGEAVAGLADTQLALARILKSFPDGTPGRDAASELQAAAEGYTAALSHPELLGGWRQRADVRYNLACCLALGGDLDGAATALQALLGAGAIDKDAIAKDSDLACVPIELLRGQQMM